MSTPPEETSAREAGWAPASTYRIQFHAGFRLADAVALLDYLDELGVGAVYASPLLAARPGSVHGYDMVDPGRLNPELGGIEDLAALAQGLERRGMGLVLDIVPNHMCIASAENKYWWDVLENGPSSPYASYFDVDWQPPKPELANKVLLPFLGEQFGAALETGKLRLVRNGGSFLIEYYDMQFPVAPRSWPLILEPALRLIRAEGGGADPGVLELESILTALGYLPARHETSAARVRERQREKAIIARRLAALLDSDPAACAAVDRTVQDMNGQPGQPRSFDRLEELLYQQAWRLSYWRVAADEINYRRFFDINELAAVRVEQQEVFDAVHRLPLEWIRNGWVKGLRIDHPDGLFDPEQYYADLAESCRQAWREGPGRSHANGKPFWVVGEKILIGGEELRESWRFHGTTGYGFLNQLNGVFVKSSARRSLERVYAAFTGAAADFQDLLYTCKKLILQVSMSSELNVLARRLDRISEQQRGSRDFTLESLRGALREVIACFPIYRTYTRMNSPRPGPEDARHIRLAIAEAKRRNPAVAASIYDFLGGLLLQDDPEGLSGAQRAERRLFVMRFQQLTAPVMAKSMEDTAFYRYFPLASLNEVGGDPDQFGCPLERFHQKNLIRRRHWPHAMISTSTHDSKRGEDARARLNVLSEIPAEWFRALRQWEAMNRRHKRPVGGSAAPSANDEYLLYQTLVATWPPGGLREENRAAYLGRIQDYLVKAVREAKLYSSWVSPNEDYEEAMRAFAAGILAPREENRFPWEFARFHARIERAGVCNALAQAVLKIASPGVPDIYQGSELWNLSLVDPDNRRPVDFARRRALLRQLRGNAAGDLGPCAARWLDRHQDGLIKLHVTRAGLRLRRAHPDLFLRGEYLPLAVRGPLAAHVIAFARRLEARVALAVTGRFFLSLGAAEAWPVAKTWGDTALLLPAGLQAAGPFRDVLTGEMLAGERRGSRAGFALAEVFRRLPFALLAGAGVGSDG